MVGANAVDGVAGHRHVCFADALRTRRVLWNIYSRSAGVTALHVQGRGKRQETDRGEEFVNVD